MRAGCCLALPGCGYAADLKGRDDGRQARRENLMIKQITDPREQLRKLRKKYPDG